MKNYKLENSIELCHKLGDLFTTTDNISQIYQSYTKVTKEQFVRDVIKSLLKEKNNDLLIQYAKELTTRFQNSSQFSSEILTIVTEFVVEVEKEKKTDIKVLTKIFNDVIQFSAKFIVEDNDRMVY